METTTFQKPTKKRTGNSKTKGAANEASKGTPLLLDVFKKVEPENVLGNAEEELKTSETLVFHGTSDKKNLQRDQEMADEEMEDTNDQQHKPQLSFEITTAFKLAYRPEAKLSTGCMVLNEFFRGGLLPKRIYELYGESGTGKTQFAMQLCLNTILPERYGGLNGNALFVMAGKFLNERRFSEIKDNFLLEYQKLAQMQQQAAPVTEAMINERINLTHASNLDEYNKIFINLAARIDQEQIKLVVIDNIHSVCDNFIKADNQIDYIERSTFLQKHSKQLKWLAYEFNLVVVILNNVVCDVTHTGVQKGFIENKSRGQSIVPSLGLLWSNCINERIGLKKRGNQDVKRTIMIDKSSYMRKNEVDFDILPQGIRGKH